ncbi:MAG: bifunctional oligoribonuclease/PAP phosphatase NrnA [Faecalibacterium sp.]|nr:bifunctional oligoribonuclease/PAP phosphatase NrnA [Faecalibacterium sp.]
MTEHLNIEQMAQKLASADHYLIVCHKNPDGDTIGCAGALYHALTALGKTAAVICADPIPARYAYTGIKLYDGSYQPETVVSVDIASLQLFGERNDVPQLTRHVDLCIDHHAGNGGFADFTLLDASAAAAAEVMTDLIEALGVQLTPQMADCLYTGLSTDTGCFKFPSTTARTHAVAARLIEAGADVQRLNKLLFETRSPQRMEIERMALNSLEYHFDGRCAVICLDRDQIADSGVEPADLEDLTGLPLTIAGVQVGLTLRQQPGGSCRISVRTVAGMDACAIARRLGGGGHNRAAGCELEGNLDNAKAAILAEVEAELTAMDEAAAAAAEQEEA